MNWAAPREYVVVARGQRYARMLRTVSKSAATVGFSITADGKMLPPFIIFKSESGPQRSWCKPMSLGSVVTASKSGWINQTLMLEWFDKVCNL
jgi:hypothetical protein